MREYGKGIALPLVVKMSTMRWEATMDKQTLAKLVWGLFLFCCCMAFWSNCKALADGEVTRSRGGGGKSRIIRREDEPESFQRYMIGMFILNGAFFVFVVVWGLGLFIWS